MLSLATSAATDAWRISKVTPSSPHTTYTLTGERSILFPHYLLSLSLGLGGGHSWHLTSMFYIFYTKVSISHELTHYRTLNTEYSLNCRKNVSTKAESWKFCACCAGCQFTWKFPLQSKGHQALNSMFICRLDADAIFQYLTLCLFTALS